MQISGTHNLKILFLILHLLVIVVPGTQIFLREIRGTISANNIIALK